jgi:acyl transferase domain-containing protein/NAD(P)H-dependent flavin oxidoreductase YrpB (nitropropane dioxygenase family)/NADP-dependent 3-hydroxy acid dehydrogenase YdfG
MAGETSLTTGDGRDLLIGVSPFSRPDPRLVLALVRAGALGVLDAGRDPQRATAAIAELESSAHLAYGVRVCLRSGLDPSNLSQRVDTVLLADHGSCGANLSELRAEVERWGDGGRRVLVEVRSPIEARLAVAAGACGLIARGSEGGGLVGEETAFILLQHLACKFDLPVWVAGGIGAHTAAGAIAGGARGVLVDAQLALLRESSLPGDVAVAVKAMDGGDTVVLGGHRVFTRPDLPVAALAPDTPADYVSARIGGDDLHTQLLPAGQEAALASSLAARWPTAGAFVDGLRRSIAEHVRMAQRLDPLGPSSPLAAGLGTRYPIAQGPMTRVSDRARFAASVADAGGLPFLALSLMSGAESSDLLEETSRMLGNRSWGAGILGFVPPEIRAAQLEAIVRVRPPVALIAGGRPAQARPLEDVGIKTYLHVPSPGLLKRFVRDGARRFVLEGRECGGHVGPRSSFALWETQIETLLASGHAGEVSVLFAGGIQDARSAAVVAAIAAPLAERGAEVGVLMGTAYLFTEEAVLTGAIQRGFQQAALECGQTVLLETAPGHSTRCADSEYVRAFAAERQRLQAAGAEPDEIWAALEVLNLGRLRIASKGLVRDGDSLVAVGEDVQTREGMFMLGQAAALRSQPSTVAALHEDVSVGGSEWLAGIEAPDVAPSHRADRDDDIAIVGMACVFPGAPDADTYWSNLVRGTDSVTEVPPERWDPEVYYDPSSFATGAGRKTPSKWGGFLPAVAFDALSYGIPPRSLEAIEPVQLLSLDVASKALDDAGYGKDSQRDFDRARISVVFGAEAGTDLASAYGFRALAPRYLGELSDDLDDALPELTEDSFPGLLTNVIAGRVANRLDLGGVNYTVDAACASSLAAVDVAVKELRAGTSDMVICGGADLHNGINDYLLFASTHALSPKGRCASFDAAADGIALGEGVACVVLKRLADAERDGDRVYAVVKAIAGSSDGRSLGLTAPRPEGQRRALERAYDQAGVSPAEVGLVEGHGTGTVVGDKTELAVLTQLFDESGAERAGCALGSVKSQIGHTKCAAGLAGLIKVARSVYHGVLPPTIHLEGPNPGFDAGESPFRFNTEARPWLGRKKVAGLSAFGFGGTNFHAVVASAGGADQAEPGYGVEAWPAELFLLRGHDRHAAIPFLDQLAKRARELAARPAGAQGPKLRDFAAASASNGSGQVQAAVVAMDFAHLAEKLEVAKERLTSQGLRSQPVDPVAGVHVADDAQPIGPGRVAFLFPGQGSQKPGMLSELFVTLPELRDQLEANPQMARVMFPGAAFDRNARHAQLEAITDTTVAQPALGIAGLAAARALAIAGIRPDMVAGHSYGELVALTVAGVIGEDELVDLSVARAEEIISAAGTEPGSMAAVAATYDEVRVLLGQAGDVVIANDNAPRQVVVSGPTAALEDACEVLRAAGLGVRRFPVSCAFHSPVVAGAAEGFAKRLADAEFNPPTVPVWSNTTARPYAGTATQMRAQLATQLASPVRFREQIEAMYEAGARFFVEVGPGQVLTGLVTKILGEREHSAIGLESGGAGIDGYLNLLAELAVRGASVDLTALYGGRAAPADLDTVLPPAPAWVVNGHLVKTVGGDVVTGGTSSLSARTAVGASRSAGGSDPRTAAVVEYLRAMRETVAAGRDVMLAYLGAPAVEPLSVPPVVQANVLDGDPAPTARQLGEPRTTAEAAPAGAAPDDAGAGGAAEQEWTTESLAKLVLGIVSERTGYPIEMLDGGLDLEADLSIDSIKRLEIVGEIADRIGLGEDAGAELDDEVTEELVRLKTLDGIVGWLHSTIAAVASAATTEGAPGTSPGAGKPSAVQADEPERELELGAAPPRPADGDVSEDVPPVSMRLVPRLVAATDAGPRRQLAAGTQIVLTDDEGGSTSAELEQLLSSNGLAVRRVARSEPLGPTDVLVHLAALGSASGSRPLGLFERAREAFSEGATVVLAVSAMDGRLGLGEDLVDGARLTATQVAVNGSLRFAGMRGVIKAIGRELPAVTARLVDLHSSISPQDRARMIFEELISGDSLVEVGRRHGERSTLHVVEEVEEPVAGDSEIVGRDAVILVTGGARGVTAKVAVELASRWGCRFVLAGRSELPDAEEDPALAAARDAVSLRRLLAQSRGGTPAEIEAEVRRILAAREIRSTLAALGRASAGVEYRRVDVSSAAATAALARDVREFYGRLDGVIHGAGVLEDARIADKSSESFERVFRTKVTGALALADSLDARTRFVVFFSSVSGIFGNRGQVDYSAANEALAAIARWLDARVAGRVVAIDWGPFAGGGMVSPELEREFARRGVGLLDVDDAVARLLGELSSSSSEPEVIVMRAQPESFGWHADLVVAAEHGHGGEAGDLDAPAGAAQISDG